MKYFTCLLPFCNVEVPLPKHFELILHLTISRMLLRKTTLSLKELVIHPNKVEEEV